MKRREYRDWSWAEVVAFVVVVVGTLSFAAAISRVGRLPVAHAQQANPGPEFVCRADDIAATLTRLTGCAAPEPGMRRYITSIVAQSTTSTSGQWILRFGTGTNCGTGTTSLLPAAATAVRLAAPAFTAAPTVIPFPKPLVVPSGQDVCLLGIATNTTTMDVYGYIAP